MPERKLTSPILAAALQGLEAERDRIVSQIAEVRRMLAGPTAPARKPGRKLSAGGRRRIAAAARKRWAEFRRKARKPAAS